ncbi:MAG: hypothetical protein WAS21_17465 [Geminicoccaceae bacterium]
MTKLPGLVGALAECDERERATLDHVARVIREAGLIPTTKRGSGAADMTLTAAANLLIAANTGGIPKAAAMTVIQYRTLVPRNTGQPDPKDGIYAHISTARDFGQAVEFLIEGAPKLLRAFADDMDVIYGGHQPDALYRLKTEMLNFGKFAGVEVTFAGPTPYAIIRIVPPGAKEPAQYQWEFMADVDLVMEGFYQEVRSDRRYTVTVGLKTLNKLFAAVSDEDDVATGDSADTIDA